MSPTRYLSKQYCGLNHGVSPRSTYITAFVYDVLKRGKQNVLLPIKPLLPSPLVCRACPPVYNDSVCNDSYQRAARTETVREKGAAARTANARVSARGSAPAVRGFAT